MANRDRDHEAHICYTRLGAYTKDTYEPIISHIKQNMGIKKFILWALKIYKYKYMDTK